MVFRVHKCAMTHCLVSRAIRSLPDLAETLVRISMAVGNQNSVIGLLLASPGAAEI